MNRTRRPGRLAGSTLAGVLLARALAAVLAGSLAVVLAGGLAGCSAARQAGAAALVAGDRVTIERLQELSAEVERAGAAVDPQTREPLSMGEVQRRTLAKLITSRILADAADREGIEVTQGDVDRRYDEFVQLAGGEEAVRQGLAMARNVPPSYARQYVRDLITSERLARRLVPGRDDDPEVAARRQEALSRVLVGTGGRLRVTVNPRYGTWQPDSGAIVALVSGGLSRTVEESGAGGDEGQ